MLAFDPQRFTTRGEDVNTGGFLEDGFSERRDGIDHVFAVVEHEQDAQWLQVFEQGGRGVRNLDRKSQRCGNGCSHQLLIRHRTDIHEANRA
jgi:hypothetical protein